jgi:hypothetical protein
VIAPKSRRLVPIAAAAVLLAVPALSSCGVNFDAQTDQYYTPSDGENNREGTVRVLDAVIVSDSPGTGRLIAALDNGATEDDTLTGVRGLEVDQSVDFSFAGGDTTIPADGVLQLADDGAAVVVVSGDPEQVAAGGYVRLAFMFQNGEEAALNVPVLAPDDTYADIEIPEPTDEPTAKPKG